MLEASIARLALGQSHSGGIAEPKRDADQNWTRQAIMFGSCRSFGLFQMLLLGFLAGKVFGLVEEFCLGRFWAHVAHPRLFRPLEHRRNFANTRRAVVHRRGSRRTFLPRRDGDFFQLVGGSVFRAPRTLFPILLHSVRGLAGV